MIESKDEQVLIEAARRGDQTALDTLLSAVRPRVRAYLVRVTMDFELA